MNEEEYQPVKTPEEAEKFRQYFTEKLLHHQIVPEMMEAFEEIDKHIDAETPGSTRPPCV